LPSQLLVVRVRSEGLRLFVWHLSGSVQRVIQSEEEFRMQNSEKFKGWRVLYRAAILEVQRTEVPRRIRQAQQAIQERTRELWYAGSKDTGERHDLAAASHYLQILHSLRQPGGLHEQKSA
jgi:hypothetical protein